MSDLRDLRGRRMSMAGVMARSLTSYLEISRKPATACNGAPDVFDAFSQPCCPSAPALESIHALIS